MRDMGCGCIAAIGHIQYVFIQIHMRKRSHERSQGIDVRHASALRQMVAKRHARSLVHGHGAVLGRAGFIIVDIGTGRPRKGGMALIYGA